MTRNIVVGITGASGACYAHRLVRCLVDQKIHVHLVFSPHGKRLFADELEIAPVTVTSLVGQASEWVTLHAYHDLGSVLASGSFDTSGMVICPCSAHSLAAIASGLGDNLLHRAAQVTLKECRRLIVVYREIPMSQLDLRNALTLSQAGAIICPANPGFYMLPQAIDELVDFVVGKVLDLLQIPHTLNTRWESQKERASSAPPPPSGLPK